MGTDQRGGGVALKYKLIVFSLVLGLLAGSYWYYRSKKSSTRATYREHVVAKEDIEITILTTGTVQPENRLEIKPPVAGRIEDVLVKEGQKVKKGETLAGMSSSERAALLDAARSKGEEELKRWEDLYRPVPIVAPISGTIIQRNVEVGQSFTSADAIFVMSDRLTVKAQVDETDIGQVKLRQSAKIVLDAYPKQQFDAQVNQIAFDAETVNNVTTYVVDVLPKTKPPFMKSGMTANVTFAIEKKEKVLVVPNEAIRRVDGKSTVLVKNVEKASDPISLELVLGITDGKRTEVLSGVSEGDIILLVMTSSEKKSKASNPFAPVPRRPPTTTRTSK